MSESSFSSIVHKDFHEAMMAKKDAEIEALRAEVATPVLVATNRLADALADARAEIAKLQEGIQSDQERLKIYGDEIAKLRAENARLKNLDMGNIVNASKLVAEIESLRYDIKAMELNAEQDGLVIEELKAEIAKLRAEREELLRRIDNFRDEFLEKALEWRGISFVDEACDKCGGSGVVAYGSTATWHGGIGGQAMTNDVCDRCWGSGSKIRKWADLRKLRAALAEKGE